MKIKDLYKVKGFPVVTVILAVVSLSLSFLVWIKPELYDYLCIETKPQYAWQYFSGCFIHNIKPHWVMWVHMLMNFMGLIPLGCITEKMIGSRKTFVLFIAELVVTAVCIQVVSRNNPTQMAGISTITYAFATVAFYSIFLVIKKKEVSCFKQPFFYYCAFEFVGMLQMLLVMNPVNAAASFAGHLSGIIVGFITVAFTKEHIKDKIKSHF